MEELFLRIFTLSASVSLVLLPLLALLPRLRYRYAPRTCYFLWLLLALRLLLPVEVSRPVFTVATPSEVVVLSQGRGEVGAQPAPGGETGRTQAGPDQGSQGAGRPSVSPPAQTGASQPLTVTALAAWVWLAVGAALLVWQVVGYWLARRALCRSAVPVQGEEADLLAEQCRALGMDPVSLVRSEHTNTPVMLGLCKPVIVLPLGPMDREDLALVLRHELLHRKRWDVAYKGLMVLCTCVHWFNPLVWWLGREAGRNLELCCDDGVLQGGDAGARRRYGELLLRTAEGRALPFSTRFGGGKGQLKHRLSNLFEKKRNSAALVGVVLAAALLAGGLVACREGRVSESEAMDRLAASISYDGSTLSFTVPDVETPSHPWVIYLYGRAEMGPDNYRSTHYLEGEDWTPGETYTVPLGEEAPGMVELSMDLFLGQTERTIDLLPYLQRVSAPTSTPAGPETAPATPSGGDDGDRPTLPEDVALGTEYLYDFRFSERYDARVSDVFTLTLPEGAPQSQLSLLARYQTTAEGETWDGEGMVPHQYRTYRYGLGSGTLVVKTDFYGPDNLEFISYLWTDLVGAQTGASVGVGSGEEELLAAYPQDLYYLEPGMGLDPESPYDCGYVYQPFTAESNDIRDITFYLQNGVVAAVELTEPYELRYVYGYDRDWGLAQADAKRSGT